ncbi:MAG: helix-turn-helix domain-containing protein [Ruminococcus sp.]|nr:helix-turn-helix domain-containing protein [Ruminococcus sp.]
MSTVFRVEKTANFTVMSNHHLKDRRLSYKAKGLLSEMLSLPPDWDYTLGGLAVIADDGVDSVRSAVRELEKFGYLVRRQSRDERGRMSVNEYFVYEVPEEVHHEQEAPAEPQDPLIFFDAPSSAKPSAEKPSAENPTTATYNKLNTKKSNTHKSNHSPARAKARTDAEDRTDRTDSFVDLKGQVNEREYYRERIKQNIEYEFLYLNRDNPKLKIDIKRVDEVVSLMTDVVCSKRNTVRVNGTELPQETVKQRFLELDRDHVDYVLTALSRSASEVRNMRAYLITALYNAPDTMESYYDAWFRKTQSERALTPR